MFEPADGLGFTPIMSETDGANNFMILALFIALVWGVLGNTFVYKLFNSHLSGSAGWAAFRSRLKLFSFLNLVMGGVCAGVGYGILAGNSLAEHLLFGAAAFFAASLLLQVVLGLVSFSVLKQIGAVQWDLAAYQLRLLSAQLVLVLPLTLTAVVAGCASLVVSSRTPDFAGPESLALLAACLIWIIQWPAIRLASLPGVVCDLPGYSWGVAARKLAKRMNIELKDVLLLRTNRAPVAGAFAISGRRVAITDHLLSALTLEEYLAIMAHEMTHFVQRKESVKFFTLAMLSVCAATALFFYLANKGRIPDSFLSVCFLSYVALIMLPLIKLKRRHEDDADTNAILFVSAEALMSAIAKTYALNGRLAEKNGDVVHRSLKDRMRTIAIKGNLPSSATNRAIESAKPLCATKWQVSSLERTAEPS